MAWIRFVLNETNEGQSNRRERKEIDVAWEIKKEGERKERKEIDGNYVDQERKAIDITLKNKEGKRKVGNRW